VPSISGLLVDITSDFHYVFYTSSFFLLSAALFIALSFCALQKKTKLEKTSKVPLDNRCRHLYHETSTEPQSESQSPPAVVYITSIWKEEKKEERKQLRGLYKATQGSALTADEKTSICFPQLSLSFCPAVPLRGAASDSTWATPTSGWAQNSAPAKELQDKENCTFLKQTMG